MNSVALRVSELNVVYGKAVAVKDVSLVAAAGEIRVVVGANGAGKSSTLNAISGVAPRSGGSVWFGDQRIDSLPAHKIARLGIVQVPEGRRMVSPLTVEENLLLGQYAARKRPLKVAYGELESVYESFPRLRERRSVRSGLLSGGEQQMLALGRALMSDPSVLLLDEPTMGLSPKLVVDVLDEVMEIARAGLAVLMVEQNAAALEVADYAYVLQHGVLVAEGKPESIDAARAVVGSYDPVSSRTEDRPERSV